ncbi:uncharacterized protein LOC143359422 [Halictus rubicundus]|uniref:uncharacterized protein LOC143359422 n=1 Tax=Halictus rubicundus TaxID=77578 RepID=UPI0040361A70
METLESSRVCRLCGKHSGISIYIFDKNENHVKKINAVLPIMVHEMDLLPKHMCHWCSYKLEQFYKFFADCLKTDTNLKGQLSWMGKEDPQQRVGTPMVHIENIKIEPPDYDAFGMTPMVGDVNYISSVKSMAFEPDDIPYAPYRCRCCCDKMDQSNRAVSTDYQNTAVSRCNRLNNEIDNRTYSRPVKVKPLSTLTQETFQERSNPLKPVNKNDNRPKTTTYSLGHIKNIKSTIVVNEDVQDTIVRNLRPRNVPVKYVTTRKKVTSRAQLKAARSKMEPPKPQLEVTQLKVERLDDLEGRILRPRKNPIDYIGPKRKYLKSTDKNQRLNGVELNASEHKVRNIASKLKLSSEQVLTAMEDTINFAVKKEQLSDLEDSTLNESIIALPKNETSNSLADKLDALPDKVENDRVNCSLLDREPSGFSDVDGSRVLKSPNKRVSAIPQPPMCLRSHNVCLRNGKKRVLDQLGVSPSKLRRNGCNSTDSSKSNSRNPMKATRRFIDVKNIAASIKLFDNIKHYCDECNTSFVNRELFKLHPCYH